MYIEKFQTSVKYIPKTYESQTIYSDQILKH